VAGIEKKQRLRIFKPGDHVLVREIWDGRVWSARPEIVVKDTPELVALWKPKGAIWKRPRNPDGGEVTPQTRKDRQWVMADTEWYGEGNLRLNVPGSLFSVLVFWNEGWEKVSYWYINLEEPLTRTGRGFDYLDMLLDAVVEPDLKNWRWKDEGELKEAIEIGIISRKRAQELHKEGERAVNILRTGSSVYNGWEKWRPDPSWKVPVLPDDWDAVD